MRTSSVALGLILLQLTFPLSALALNAEEELTPAQIRQQLWDTECRTVLPFGQGDLAGALLTRLRQCINEKQNAWLIGQKRVQELERMSQRDLREQARRAAVLHRLRTGTQQRIEKTLPRRAEQSTLLLRYRSRNRYQQIHESLRLPGSTNSTTEDEG